VLEEQYENKIKMDYYERFVKFFKKFEDFPEIKENKGFFAEDE